MPVLLEASIEKADINLHIYKDIKSKIRSTFGFLWTEKSYGAYKKNERKIALIIALVSLCCCVA